MPKDMTTDELAGMTERGFTEISDKVDKGFTKTEENFTEMGLVMREMLTEIRELRKDGQEVKEILKNIALSHEARIEKLESKSI